MARILVVDDEPNIRKMVRLALARDGHQVEVVDDGPAALARFDDGAGWDGIVVDERMPGMAGREVVHEVFRRDPSARVVMMTAFDTPELASAVVREGATDFLAKPFTADTLRHALAVVLGRPRLPFTAQADLGASGSGDAAPERRPISYWVNGYGYWRADPDERIPAAIPPGIRVCRTFHVAGQREAPMVCVVAVMPHVEEEVALAAGRPVPADAPVWDMVCHFALRAYFRDSSTMPPAVLPVYELSSDELEDVRRTES